MQLKTIFNRVTKYKPFVVAHVEITENAGEQPTIEITMRARENGLPMCSGCSCRCSGYDTLPVRRFDFIPLWLIPVVLIYSMRRVNCPSCGVKVERVPWAEGKSRLTIDYQWFLAGWARRMSWKEVSECFRVSWDHVYNSVKHAVSWGMSHRSLEGIESLGIDEVQWKRGHNLVRVGANVQLLSEQADVKKLGGGIVLCWPKGRMQSGDPPLRLRLVRVKVGKTRMWMLTSVLDRKKLPNKQIVRYYKMRWGIEVEFRGLKQTIDKHKLRCRNSDRLLVELDWSLRAMAIAELIALREQIPATRENKLDEEYAPEDRSLANTMRAMRKCMRNLNKYCDPENGFLHQLSQATVQRYDNQTDKRARYRPKNPDKKPLGDPTVRNMNAEERERLRKHDQSIAT